MKIAVGCDHGGFALKTKFIERLLKLGHEVEDAGCFDGGRVDYPEYGAKVGRLVASGSAEKGVLVCGTGIGISIAANKIRGVRAAVCNDLFCAEMSRRHNDANVLCVGGRVVGEDVGLAILEKWLDTPFDGERHTARVAAITALEDER